MQNFDGSFALIDKAGTVLQRLDLDPSLALHQSYGATAVTDETSFGLYLASAKVFSRPSTEHQRHCVPERSGAPRPTYSIPSMIPDGVGSFREQRVQQS